MSKQKKKTKTKQNKKKRQPSKKKKKRQRAIPCLGNLKKKAVCRGKKKEATCPMCK